MQLFDFFDEIFEASGTYIKYSDSAENAIFTIKYGFLDSKYIYIDKTSLILVQPSGFSTQRFEISYEDINNLIIERKSNETNITLFDAKFNILYSENYVENVIKIIEIIKKYNIISVDYDMCEVANKLNLEINEEIFDTRNTLFLYHYSEKFLKFIENSDSDEREVLKEFCDYIILSFSFDPKREYISQAKNVLNIFLENKEMAYYAKFNPNICERNFFFQYCQIVVFLKILGVCKRIYSIVESNSGEVDGGFISRGAKSWLEKGFGETMLDIFENVGKKILNDKVFLVLLEDGVMSINLDKESHFFYTLDEALRFQAIQDDYFPNALDIYENNINKSIIENVHKELYYDFYKKAQNLYNQERFSINQTKIPTKKEKLIELKELFDEGLIDEDEYKSAKSKIFES